MSEQFEDFIPAEPRQREVLSLAEITDAMGDMLIKLERLEDTIAAMQEYGARETHHGFMPEGAHLT